LILSFSFFLYNVYCDVVPARFILLTCQVDIERRGRGYLDWILEQNPTALVEKGLAMLLHVAEVTKNGTNVVFKRLVCCCYLRIMYCILC
jgi:hypothetical protein